MRTHPDELLDALDPDQRAVAIQVGGPLAVLAGAGTGKTRAITYRIAYAAATGAIDPTSVLAVTFTARAATEMRTRLRDLGVPGVQARTFHSAALRQLQYFWPSVVGGPVPALVEHKASLVAAAAARTHISVDRALVRDVAAEIEWAKVSMISPEDYSAHIRRSGRATPGGLSVEDVVRLLDAYEECKEERAVIDFEDVLANLAGILVDREDIARRIRSQYRSFVVDEYQDVSALQQYLLDLWLGGRHDICVVGDVSQTIYSFAGATPHYLTSFAQKHPGARIVELNRDYRSTPQIVDIANRVIEAAGSAPGAHAGAVHLVSQRPSGAPVRFITHDDERSEAEYIAHRVRELSAQGTPLHSIAVLYRTNSQSEALEQALAAQNISFLVRGGARFFDREEVRKGMLALRRIAASTPDSDEGGAAPTSAEVSTSAEVPTSGPAPTTLLVEQVQDALRPLGWSQQAPEGRGATREKWDNLNALVELARQRPGLNLRAFVDELAERATTQAAPTVDGVTLTTIHAAKGLEWDVVFLIGASEGLIPISMATTGPEREEERRLLYVAITRARDLLEISWARSRGEGGKATRQRSRLLDGIWPQEMAGSRRATPTKKTPKKKGGTDARDELTPESAELFERLRAWRLLESRHLEVPAYTVLTDRTLTDIAIARPKTLTQLRVIKGVGDIKLQRYGAAVLAIIRGEEVVPGGNEMNGYSQ
ncbi:MAG: ATP-dependent DNA helicase UvrD2 [Actinomycetaceae bacterium]|nr:ATP-dependent DNA helicase UvrD2 [Actinomycetaceae bacterium]